MTYWISVDKISPPKDRAIEITSGFIWSHSDYYSKYSNDTHRSWNLRGKIIIVRWIDADFLKNKEFPDGAFVGCCEGDGIPPQNFKFWREYDNPLEDNIYGQDNPPETALGAFGADYPGDATRSKYLQEANKKYNEYSIFKIKIENGSLLERDGSIYPSTLRFMKSVPNSLRELFLKADNAYDPPFTNVVAYNGEPIENIEKWIAEHLQDNLDK